jgi:8-oxo-dGTP pyrophosphatase MutT (NUDIX family)
MRGSYDKASILAHANVVNVSAAVIIEHNDTFLLIKETVDGKISYNFPSGKAHLDELIEQTARREVMEETGYEVELTAVSGVYYYRTKNNSNDRKKDRITIRFNFWGRLRDEKQSQRPTKDTVSLAWVSPLELRELITKGEFRNWIAKQVAEDALANQKAPLATVKQFKR